MGGVRSKLSVMMFLQYFIWGCWAVPLGSYLGLALKFPGDQIGWVYSSTAIAAMIAPLFVGYVADRLFATERILGILHLVGGVLLAVAATQKDFMPLMSVMVLYSMCYMPTLALTNSLSFRNIGDPEKEFPLIRVFGTFGWIAAGLTVGAGLGETVETFFYLAAGASVVLGLFCFVLPHTPPNPASASSSQDVLGLGALSMFKSSSFTIFAVCSLLICIPLTFYYNFTNQFLSEIDAPAPAALQTLGQFSEIIFMTLMPVFIGALGVRWMLLIGMAAWVLRYILFSTLNLDWVIVGLVLHGICYDFFFVASQIYVDRKAPRALRSSAQSLIAFITFGVGMFIGSIASGWVVGAYPAMKVSAYTVSAEATPETVSADSLATAQPVNAPLPEVAAPPSTSVFAALDLKSTIRKALFGEKEAAKLPDFFDIADKNKDGKIEKSEVPAVWIEQKARLAYLGSTLTDAIDKIGTNGAVDRPQWRKALANDWSQIWIWPAGMAGATLLIFFLGFRDDGKTGGDEDAAGKEAQDVPAGSAIPDAPA